MLPSFVHEWIAQYGVGAIFALLVLGIVGLPVPDEVLLIFVGSLIARGRIGAAGAVAAAASGALVGITCSYFLGRLIGRAFLRYGKYIHLKPERVERVHQFFERVGKWALIFGYFIPGVRHLTAFVAGTSRLHFGAFALFAYSGGVIWVGTFLTLGYVLGEHWHHVAHLSHLTLIGLAAALLMTATLGVMVLRRRRAEGKA